MEIPPYLFCACVGFVISTSLYIVLMFSKKYDLHESIKVFLLSIAGLILGAKFFGCLSGVYRAIGVGEPIKFETIKNTGIVFYGGLFGMLVAYKFLLGRQSILDRNATDVLAVIFPLFHCVARIGCFFAGCCFGEKYSGIMSIEYTITIHGVENTCARIPVQLMESVFNFFLFLYLLGLIKHRDWRKQHVLIRYLLIYSVGRFFLEYFRGDDVRGLILNVSFSQMISILILITILFYLCCKRIVFREDVK